MPQDVAKAAAQAAADIKSGKNKIFTGPIKDNSGKVRVPAGKTLNDGELFTTLDYYVEGIKGKSLVDHDQKVNLGGQGRWNWQRPFY